MLRIRLHQGSILLGLFYRPPSASTSFDALDQAMDEIPIHHRKSVVLIGDFNIDLLADGLLSPGHCSLADFAAKHNLSQAVTEPTRVSNNTSTLIDHVYVSNIALLRSCCTVPPLASSDHRSVLVSLTWTQALVRKVRRLVWKYSAADYEGASNELAIVPPPTFSTTDIDQHWYQWKDRFLAAMSRHIPSRKVVTRRCLPWLSQEIRILINKRDRLFRKAKQTVSRSVWEAFRKSRNRAVSALRSAKRQFYNHLSTNVKTPKQFWSVYRSLSPNRHRLPALMTNGSTSVECAQAKCELLNSHFAASFTGSGPISDTTVCISPNLSSVACDNGDVLKAISSLPSVTASGPDGISSRMLKGTADVISHSLSNLFNLSLVEGVVPSSWKLSNITPVFKAGDPKLVSNYRPISLLSLPSKLLERIIHNKLMPYLLSNSILSQNQFGFRPASSTQEALISATGDWHRHLDSKKNVAAVFFDLSKAFDTVPHHGLLKALSKIGIVGSLHRWFTSYLTSRRQQVVLDGCSSSRVPVTSGVPQGSILGPLLFSIYVNPIALLPLSSMSRLLLYADDILLYKPISSAADVTTFQADIDSVCEWISTAGLKLNASKTKLLVVTRQKDSPSIQLSANGTHINQVKSVLYLGVTLCQDMSFSAHIHNVCLKAKSQLGLLHRLFHKASPVALNQLYKSLVLPTLDYCSSLWDPYYEVHIKRLESVQKFAARLVSKRWQAPHDQLLKSLRWEHLALRRKKQKVLLCHRILRGGSLIPSTSFTPHPSLQLRHTNSQPLFCPHVRSRGHLSSFFVSVVPLWNSISPSIMSFFMSLSFKSRLKKLDSPFLT